MISTINTYSAKEEMTNALSHGIGTVLSIVALFLLLTFSVNPSNNINIQNSNEITRIISFSIYGSSLILLFLASTFYHSLINEKHKKLFKLLDHCAIYLLIAGTYTPLLLLTIKGILGHSLLVLIWGIAVAGIIFKVKFGSKYKKISLATYLGMGFISFSIIGKIYQALPSEALTLFASGGLIYCFGVIFYVQKKIPFNHAIWHLFVLGGAACHFFMIYLYV
ncbi:MAG: hemolysin III family protein [Colwellia sp.]